MANVIRLISFPELDSIVMRDPPAGGENPSGITLGHYEPEGFPKEPAHEDRHQPSDHFVPAKE
jgi:hypothetical protein